MRNQRVVGLFAAATAAVAAAMLLVVPAATGAGAAAAVKISTRTVPKLGTILVDARGRTLYMFVPDRHRKVTCVGSCAAIWPPVKLAKAAKAVASGKAKASLLGSDRNPAGGRVVTYAGWPL